MDFHVNVNVDFFYCRPPCHVARCFVIFWPPCPTPIFFVGHLFHIHANLWSLSDNSKVDNFLVSDNILKNILISFHESFKGGHSESTNGGVWKQMNISASWKNLFHLGKVSKWKRLGTLSPTKVEECLEIFRPALDHPSYWKFPWKCRHFCFSWFFGGEALNTDTYESDSSGLEF